jgi:hypothetical protein
LFGWPTPVATQGLNTHRTLSSHLAYINYLELLMREPCKLFGSRIDLVCFEVGLANQTLGV